MFILLSGLVSTLDSNLAAMSSLVGHDAYNRWAYDADPHVLAQQERIIKWSRIAMALLAIVAVGIANIPGMKVLYLFLFYGALRSSTLTPTVISLLRRDKFVSERGMFWGIVVALAAFVPLFAWGNFNGVLWANLTGIIGIIASSALIVTGFTFYDARVKDEALET
jgi:Na+/proline symporter